MWRSRCERQPEFQSCGEWFWGLPDWSRCEWGFEREVESWNEEGLVVCKRGGIVGCKDGDQIVCEWGGLVCFERIGCCEWDEQASEQ